MALGTLTTLPSAARKLGISEAELRALIEKGKINLGISPSGEIVVTEDDNKVGDVNEQLAAIRRDSFEHLRGQQISITDATDKYAIGGRVTVWEWVKRGYVRVLETGQGRGRGSRMLLDEADVAYCAKIYLTRQQAGVYAGTRLLDEQGKPNLLKHPDLSRYRRERKQAGK